MEVIEIARRLSDLNQVEDAQKAYFMVLQQSDKDIERYEAALFLLYTSDNKKVPYSILIELHKKGLYQNEIMQNMMEYALVPEIEKMESTYSNNIKALKKYPYIFKKDFKSFEDLRIRYFKIDENGFVGFDQEKELFDEYEAPYLHKINHYFFKDLENPIYAEDIYSQYELEYLNDNVRKSEWVAKDNHIYLYYSSFEEFQNYLQIIDFTEMLKEKKFVFLFEEEKEMYPIDFKERFNIDYSKYTVKGINVREIKKLIWGVQYSSHNGGDFFNEIIDSHPNIICTESEWMENYRKLIELNRKGMNRKENSKVKDKEILLNIILRKVNNSYALLDLTSRIVPALYIQPHFPSVNFNLITKDGFTMVSSNEITSIGQYAFINDFKYIKTFVPIRRFTTSLAAEMKFQMNKDYQNYSAINNHSLADRLLNKALYINKNDRLFIDSKVVRFEDGKLNPKATFTALAEFLDVPYTKSMTYCSGKGQINPESLKGNALGFDPSTVYKTYDEFCDDEDRIILEYFYRDMMDYYGYESKYLKKSDLNLEELNKLANDRTKLKELMLERRLEYELNELDNEEEAMIKAQTFVAFAYGLYQKNLGAIIELLYNNYPLINEEGIQLELMESLKLDESLLEQPLYK